MAMNPTPAVDGDPGRPARPEPARIDPWNVGRTLKSLRVHQGLSMRELAARAGVSQPFLSKVENGLSHPSVGTLYRLADALRVPAQDLLPAVDGDLDVQRSAPRPAEPMTDSEHTSHSKLLVGGPGRIVEARHLTVTVRPAEIEAEWFEHDGEEFVQVLSGDIEIEFADGRRECMTTGDSLWYRSTLAHRWTNRGSTPSEVLIVNARLPFLDHDASSDARSLRGLHSE
jgi:transcriptional regulator with XRE-family HTH domain